MRIVLATAHPYIPQIAGGAQSNMHEMALSLKARGHEVFIVAGLTGARFLGLRARLTLKMGSSFHTDSGLGYSVFRSWHPWKAVVSVVAKVQPDVAVVQSGLPARMADAFRSAGVPTVVHFHNVEADDLVGMTSRTGDAYIANSQFTATRAECIYGISPVVIVPSFIRTRYAVEPDGDFITLINPHPKKGLRLMVEVASRMPDHKFLFVRSWSLNPEDEALLQEALRRCPNITLSLSVEDMRAVYRRTRLLLLPSLWEEAWGRVATEAHFSGIPVVGSNRGGIPEAIGPGGVIMPVDADADAWVSELSTLSADPVRYEALRIEALRYADRAEINLDLQLSAFEQVCRSVVRMPNIAL